jgi:hypothetical protein
VVLPRDHILKLHVGLGTLEGSGREEGDSQKVEFRTKEEDHEASQILRKFGNTDSQTTSHHNCSERSS